MFAELDTLIEAIAGSDGFWGVGDGFKRLGAGVLVAREEPAGDAGEGFLLAEGWAGRSLQDEGQWWGRDEGVGMGRGGGGGFFIDGFEH